MGVAAGAQALKIRLSTTKVVANIECVSFFHSPYRCENMVYFFEVKPVVFDRVTGVTQKWRLVDLFTGRQIILDC